MTDNDCKVLEEESDRCMYAYVYNGYHFGEFDKSLLRASFDRMVLVLAYRKGLWHGSK